MKQRHYSIVSYDYNVMHHIAILCIAFIDSCYHDIILWWEHERHHSWAGKQICDPFAASVLVGAI